MENLKEQIKSFSVSDLSDLIDFIYEVQNEKSSSTDTKKVVFTIEGRTPEGEEYTKPIIVKNSDEEYEEDEEDEEDEEYEDHLTVIIKNNLNCKFRYIFYNFLDEHNSNGEVKINTSLTNFMYEYFPSIMKRLNPGDIIKLQKETYRNDYVFLITEDKQITELCVQEGLHDYGFPPVPLRKYFKSDWEEYGFCDNYPELI